MQQQDRNDDELTRRLEAYAEARLSPELSATIRMRTRVMTAAHRQAALARADADRAAAVANDAHGPIRHDGLPGVARSRPCSQPASRSASG